MSGLCFSYALALLPTTTYIARLPVLKACVHLRTTQDAKKTGNKQEKRRNNQSGRQRAKTRHEHDKKQATQATTNTRNNMTPGS